MLYSVISTTLGKWVDRKIKGLNATDASIAARDAIKYIGGVHFVILAVIIVASTFIPRGAFALNPRIFNDDEEKDGEFLSSPARIE